MADYRRLTALCLLALYVLGLEVSLVSAQTSTVGPDAKTKRFQDAIQSCSLQCQMASAACLSASPKAQELMAKEQYCNVMNLNDGGVSTYDCLVKSHACTQGEFDKVKTAACGGAASLVVTSFTLLLSAVALFLSRQ
ncbi:uncharacterized protein LOC131944992 [Physella acuta]|uniref:uncharacterized protein LOC131944992 n=1 Tax=Physella acuta TaxID=109671 RepID=UPI0027DBC42F|nr:uncharacterized protein LOC131944992 [Physella acuta]